MKFYNLYIVHYGQCNQKWQQHLYISLKIWKQQWPQNQNPSGIIQVGTSAAVMIITQAAEYMMTAAATVIKTRVVVVVARLIRDWRLVAM